MRKKGFTLVEIMIVIMIIGILSAIAIPNFLTARVNAQKNSCIANLHTIEAAKEQWAMDTRAATNATPTQAQLVGTATDGYIKYFPVCPGGGTYNIQNLLTRPTCNRTGHVLQ